MNCGNNINIRAIQVKLGVMLLALCIISAITSPLLADMTITMAGYGDLRRGTGGEFTFFEGTGWDSNPLDAYNPIATHNGGFQTFCLEKHEYIWANNTYNVEISQSAKNGGINNADNATAGQDNISDGTAWLYGQFAAGTLYGYNYDISNSIALEARKASGEILQNAIWGLEDENALDAGNQFIQLLIMSGQFANIAQAKQDYLGDKVSVMNLTTLTGRQAQDQLIATPLTVPAPGALTLSAIGAFIAIYRKRKNIA